MHMQRRGDKPDLRSTHLVHTDTISEDEEITSGTEGEDPEVEMLTDLNLNAESPIDDVIPKIPSPLASVSSGEASVLSSVGGAASSSIVKLGLCSHVLTEDPDGMCFINC